MTIPQNKITIDDTTTYVNLQLSAVITMLENGFDTATIELPDNLSAFYPDTITTDTTIQLDVKDSADGDWITQLKGINRFPILPFNEQEIITLKCDGAGYPLAETVCAQEYGSQSRNASLNTVREIIKDSTYGIIPKYVNKILGSATDSGYSIDTDDSRITDLAGDIPYLYSPYKPNNKLIDDLCDLHTAISAEDSYAGPHWRVDTDGQFRLKRVDATQTGWTKYYGDSQANATLEQGKDFTSQNWEPIGPECNYFIYNGIWRRPSNGDWAENNSASWDNTRGGSTLSDESDVKILGDYSVKAYNAAATGAGASFIFPESIDLSYFTSENIPNITVSIATDRVMTALTGALIYNNFFIRLFSAAAAYSWINPGNDAISKGSTSADINFQTFNYQLGPYSKDKWQQHTTSVDWSNLIEVEVWCPNVQSAYIDSLSFGGAQVTRIAKNSTSITANNVKMRSITDTTPKDDTLTSGTAGTTDTGLMARLAYAELLRQQTSSIVGSVTVPMLKDALPGQWFHIHAKKKADGNFTINKDMRATKVTQIISPSGYFTTLELTDDLTNTHPRPRYEDRNKIVAAQRPDFQDRQSSSIKAGQVDIRVTPLEEDYPS